jgi:hypothetical protein
VTTARNWAGCIGRFTLTVDTGRADALVSFCRQGVRKTGPTTFVWEARDYVPDSDLRMLLVSNDPHPEVPRSGLEGGLQESRRPPEVSFEAPCQGKAHPEVRLALARRLE